MVCEIAMDEQQQAEWSDELTGILDDIAANSLVLAEAHRRKYIRYKSYAHCFEIPVIIMSVISSTIAAGPTQPNCLDVGEEKYECFSRRKKHPSCAFGEDENTQANTGWSISCNNLHVHCNRCWKVRNRRRRKTRKKRSAFCINFTTEPSCLSRRGRGIGEGYLIAFAN